ncbi:MAG: ABC transporter permease subunit [Gaiellaceae bacterium MAG52_C11]|nr:ABC transporter permease subunit [Candidatus Gaiellasilicea maunaloa]
MDVDRAPLGRLQLAAAAAIPIAFLAIFFVYPLATIVGRGLAESGSSTFATGETLRIAWFTTWQAALSTALTLAVGLPLAWVVGRFAFRGRSLVLALVLVPFVLPTLVVATAFVAVLPGRLDRSVPAILLAHAFFNVAVVVRVVGGYWAGLGRTTEAAATVLGAGPWRRLREVTLPQLAPALAAASALTFLFSFTSFGVVVVLGGPRIATLETEIYSQAARLFDLRTAAVLSLVQLGAVAAIVVVASRLEGRLLGGRSSETARRVLRRPRGRERWLVGSVLGSSAVLLGLPLAALIRRSLSTPTGIGLDHYRVLRRETSILLVTPLEAAANSLLFATLATGLALAVGGLLALALARLRPGWLDALVLLPLGGSAVMLGFGFVIAFDEPPLELRGSALLVPVAQALVAAPFVFRIVAPAIRSVRVELREAAALLGGSPLRVRREIDLPLVARALGGAAGFAFAIALGEFGATIFVAQADRPTLPVAIFRFLGRPGAENQGSAAALAVVLALLAAAAALVAERAGGRRSPL